MCTALPSNLLLPRIRWQALSHQGEPIWPINCVASSSIVLNIAEGAGEFSGDEKARFYRFARRSATECAAALDVCRALQFASPEQLIAGREMLLKIIAMLVRLIQSVQQSGKGTGMGKGTDRSL